jgi:NAD(P)-dependent dehydrogenase (short-subunit alcohol dehydrogenase family)
MSLVITGGGRGIGRETALLAAAEGASVIVNDLGAGPEGFGSDAGPADEVVAAIRAAGGTAVANADNVAVPSGASRLVAAAIDSFGRLDCVINAAGILRDQIFHKMEFADFEKVIEVHLFGSFLVSRAAAPHFRRQESGTFVHFTSGSGLIGSIGQANYSAAKMGIVGLSRSIALDMARFNVRSNCVCPFAWTRLIGTIPTESDAEKVRVERLKAMNPAKVAALAVFLGSPLSDGVTGQIIGARQNEIFLFSQPRPIRSVHRGDGWTPTSLAEHMLPAVRSSLTPLERSPDVFSWDPV